MGRIVTFDTGYQTVSAAQDLLELKLGTGQFAFFLSAAVMQSSDESASEAEELQVAIKRAAGSFTSGSGGGTATVIQQEIIDSAHGLATIERNNTTQAVVGTGTLEIVVPGVFNVLAGEWNYTPIPEMRIPLMPSQALVFSLDEAPADALTLRAIVVLLIFG